MCDIKTYTIGSQWEKDVRIANILAAVLIVALAFLASDAGAEEKIYKWVDETGAVHFGDMPPDNVAAKQIEVVPDTVSVPPSSAAAEGADAAKSGELQPSLGEQLRAERAQAREERAAQQEQLAKECEKARKLVAELEPSPRVIVQTKDGQIERLDDDVRLENLNEARTFITENCDKK
jgi:hypothetical protein